MSEFLMILQIVFMAVMIMTLLNKAGIRVLRTEHGGVRR